MNRFAYVLHGPRVDDAVVLRDPEMLSRYLLKRISATNREAGDQTCYDVLGDNVGYSRDSRAFGSVPRHAIVGKVWFASGTLFNEPKDVPYGIASVENPGMHDKITYYDPIRDVGLSDSDVRDLLALPDGRLVVAGLHSGLVIWDPVTGAKTSIRAGKDLPSDRVLRIQLDTMVDPPALLVATQGGAAVIRVLP